VAFQNILVVCGGKFLLMEEISENHNLPGNFIM